VVPVQVLEPIEAEVTESEDFFTIELNIEDFKVDDVTVELVNNNLLKVSGERKKTEDAENPGNSETDEPVSEPEPEVGLSRKSFGRMFWIPDGCDTEAIEATARLIYGILNLEIRIPKTGSEQVPGQASDQAEETRNIVIKLL